MSHFFASSVAPLNDSTNIYAVLAGMAYDTHKMKNYTDYENLIADLDAQDPLSLDLASLKILYEESSDDAIGGFLLGLMEVRCNLTCFSSMPGKYLPDPESLDFVGKRLLEGFSIPFMRTLDDVNPMSASPEDLLHLASSADEPFSKGYCIAVLSLRSQICMIHPKYGDGLAINTAMSSIPGLFAMQPSPAKFGLVS